MKRPSKKVLNILFGKFPDFTFVEVEQSPNSLPFIASRDGEQYFFKVVDKEQIEIEGLEGIEEALLGMRSDNLVKLYESGDINDQYKYLKFEFIDGFNLDDIKRKLSETEIKQIASDIGAAIEVLWEQGIVHRDIKPKNIMLDSTTGKYKLVDLGIGYFAEAPYRDNAKSRSNGSRFYSSPEQFASNQDETIEITFSTDQFSLGLILFERATELHPYKTYDEKKYSNYGAAVSMMPAPKILNYTTDFDPEFANVINKMVETEPCDRFISVAKMNAAINSSDSVSANRQLKVYLQDTEDGAGYRRLTGYLTSSEKELYPDGIMVSASNGSLDRVKDLKKLGIDVVIDPATCRLPYRDASTTLMKSKYGLNRKKVYTASQIPSNLDKITEGVIDWQAEASLVVLPYFAIRDSNDDFLRFNKEIWRKGRSLLKEGDDRKVYGGIAIPSDILADSKTRKSMLAHLLSKYNIDGMFVIFENGKKSIKSLDDKELLTGIKETLDVLYEIGDVIIAKADMALLPLMRGGSFVTAFTESRRRFAFNEQFDSPSGGGGGSLEDRKLKYFCDSAYTFIEEKTNLTGIASDKSLLSEIECKCSHCDLLKPFESGAKVDHQLAENHFYNSVMSLRNELNSLKSNGDKDSYLRKKITEAIRISDRIKAETYLTSKEISDHKSLLGLIDY